MTIIDTHVNGALGIPFSSAMPDQVRIIRKHLERKHQIGGFLASLVSLPRPILLRGIAAIREGARGPGAKVLGIHLEGPFLNPARRGAHRRASLRRPDVRELAEYVRAADGMLRLITIAPELPGALKLIREARRCGVLVSVGHSDATYDEARRAFAAGATHVTHLFNAMRGFHHRSPGLIEAALLEPVYVELIYDRVHVSRQAVEMALRCKDRRLMLLASDASAALDAPDGEYVLDGTRTIVRRGRCFVKGSGRLAGSMASLKACVRYFNEDFGGGLDLATRNPARFLGKEA